MQLKRLLFFALISIPYFVFSQSGIVSGKITDASNNQALIGATITIANTPTKALSDVDGNYRFAGLKAGKYTLNISYIGYDSKQITEVEITTGHVTTLNIALEQTKNTTLQQVVVTATSASKESINSLLITRKNAAVVSDAISAEMIRKSPDKNIGDVLKRVSGTTVQDNKFVVVRGMSDRYNEALLNGVVLPSTEADRKSFAFDIFPADLVDNITVIKSASPEYPGSFAGGLVIVNLKDVPDKNFFSIKGGLGYNSITTGKEFDKQASGNLDFIGLDDGTRALPQSLPNTKTYHSLNPDQQIALAKKFDNDWKLYRDQDAPMNSQLQLTGAFTSAGKTGYPKYGGIFGLSYNSTYRTSHLTNNDYGDVSIIQPDSLNIAQTNWNFKDTSYTHTVLSSAIANFTMKVDPNNKFFFNNLFTINSTIQSIARGGLSIAGTGTLSPYYAYIHYFQSNVLINNQIGGEHYLPKYKLRIKWSGTLTNFHRDEPDYRQMIYFTPYEGSPLYAYLGSPTLSNTTIGGIRFYYDTRDHGQNANVDLNKSFKFLGNPQTFKFGFAYYHFTRDRQGRFLRNDEADYFNFDKALYPPDVIFDPKNFNPNNGFVLTDFAQKEWTDYDGSQKNIAGYAMFDNKLTEDLRLSWGARFENYRNIVNGYESGNTKVTVDSTYQDFLPSVNLIYSMLPKANLRLSYSRTVVRPLYREIAATQFYDFLYNATFYGSRLSETHIDNYEIRWEQFFQNGQFYSISGFYKKFKDAIEQKIVIAGADSRTITWQNVNKAETYGVELEACKDLEFITPALSDLSIYANTAFMKSTAFVKGNGSDTMNRPLQGQSPYVINAALQYSGKHNGLNVSLLYNVIGERIAFIGGLEENYIWEKPHGVLDFKIGKNFMRDDRGLIELSLSDILHKNDVMFWDMNNNKKYDANFPDVLVQSRSFGMTATLSVGYKF